jgi:hypothetical protein
MNFQSKKYAGNAFAAGNRGRHAGPHPGIVAIIYTLLFGAGLGFAIGFHGGPHFPGPWEPMETIAAYFQSHANAVRWCAVLQFGAAIPLGIFTATMVSRLHFLGARMAGVYIALFGGLLAAFDTAASAHVLWVMAHAGVAQDTAVLRALYYLGFSFAGAGFSVPMGLLLAGICVPAGFMGLLPKWLVGFGLIVALVGELSVLNMIFPQALFLVPLTRFPSFIWLIAAGFALPNVKRQVTDETNQIQPKEIK